MIVSGRQHLNGTHPARQEQRGPGELPTHGASAADSTPATAEPHARRPPDRPVSHALARGGAPPLSSA